MHINMAHIICYSPTGTTRKSLENIAIGMGVDSCNLLDLTLPAGSMAEISSVHEGIAIIGAPVYAGRVAPEAVSRLQRIEGNNSPAVVVVTYGNRDYEDALIELKKLAEDAGFIPVAAAAVVGEHSYSSDDKSIAAGRPDIEDGKITAAFGGSVMEKLRNIPDLTNLAPLEVPGTIPTEEYKGPRNISPDTNQELCTLCGRCADVCPLASVTVEDYVETNKETCTMCSACIKECPTGARKINIPRVLERIDMLFTNCQKRKDPEFFL